MTIPIPAMGIHAHPARKLGVRPIDQVALSRMIELPVGQTVAGLDIPSVADHLTAAQPLMVMGGNDKFGTCWPTSVANSVILASLFCAGIKITVLDDDVFTLYRQVGNPNFDPVTGAGDNGTEPTAGLSALAAEGIWVTHLRDDGVTPDPQQRECVVPICYAQSSATDVNSLRVITAAAGSAQLCLDLHEAQQAQTDTGLWDYAAGSPEWGGHAVIGGSYKSPASAHAWDETIETWRRPVGLTDGFIGRQLQIAVVLVWPDLWSNDAFMANVDRAALADAYQQVTGQPIGRPS